MKAKSYTSHHIPPSLCPGENITVIWDQRYLLWERNDQYYPIMVKPLGELVPGLVEYTGHSCMAV